MKAVAAIIMFCMYVSTIGCWDKIDIDRNYFVSAISVDAGEDIDDETAISEAEPEEPFGERHIKRLKVTFVYPDLSVYSPTQPNLKEDKYIESEAYSMADSLSNAIMKSSRNVNIEQAKVLILGDELLKHDEILKEVFDYFARDPKINKNMYLIGVKGEAEDIVKFKVSGEKTMGNYLSGLMESSKRTEAILPVKLKDFLIYLAQNGNGMLPSIEIDKDKQEVALSGVSVIKKYKIEGNINLQDTTTIEMLRGTMKSAKKTIYKDGHPIDLEIDNSKRKVRFAQEDGRLIFNIDLKMEGKIRNHYLGDIITEKEKFDKIEEYFGKSLSEEGERVAKKMQTEYNVDVIGLREYIEKFRPSLWKEIEADWEEKLKEAVVVVNVDVSIRRVGARR